MDLTMLQQEYLWGAALWRLAAAALLFVVSLFSRRTIRLVIRRMLDTNRVWKVAWVQALANTLPRPLSLVAQIALWYGTALLLTLPQAPYNVHLLVTNGLLAALAIAFAAVLFKLIDVAAGNAARKAALTDTRLDDQLIPLVRKTLKILLITLIAIGIMEKLGYPPSSLIAGLSVGGLALALAAKDTVANLFGSAVVFADQPFHVGDWVMVSGTEGAIEEIGLRVTRIRQVDKSLATIPNQAFTTTTVVNYSKRPQRRLRHTIILRYTGSPEVVAAFITSIRTMLLELEQVDSSTAFVHLESFQEAGLGILVQALTLTPGLDDFLATQETVLMNILQLAKNLGLRISFPSGSMYIEREGAAL